MCPPPSGSPSPPDATRTSTESVPDAGALPPTSMSPDELGGRSSATAKDVENSGTSSPATMIEGPPRYPPSAVKQWLTCPEFWRLSKVWEPRAVGWTPHMLVGTAIHAGVAAYLRPQIVGSVPASPENPVSVALEVLTSGYQEQETWALEGLQALTEKGLTRLQTLMDDTILPGATVLAVEYSDPVQDPRLGTERLHRVVDCILARGDGLEVWDWKTKIRLDEAYLGETTRAVLHSWQLLDYSWHTSQWAQDGWLGIGFTGPAWQVNHAAHGLVVLGPKLLAQAIPVQIILERLSQWRSQAVRVWAAMWECQRQDGPALMNWEACSDRHLHYGRECQFVPACHHLCGNEERFSGVYRRKVSDDV